MVGLPKVDSMKPPGEAKDSLGGFLIYPIISYV
jgi:hypothetical protein